MQLSAMRSYAKKRGWTVAVEVKDVGSGATTRPLREKLIETARRREIDSVIVWRLDRWGRSLVDLVNTLQELTALDVGFVSLSEALDLTIPSGRALAGMLAVFAEFERVLSAAMRSFWSSAISCLLSSASENRNFIDSSQFPDQSPIMRIYGLTGR